MWWWIEKLLIIVSFFISGGFSAYGSMTWGKLSEKK
ncbi:hypothetical protein ALMA_0054 [Alloscardovia macacae]|uniref:Uncharacterized protein n=1 Tax=Alloscardovia macacae TaxID=1160091 RepID=A0A261F6F7_9BIFI|nr:hypothetical protein ALMA_0054 [Alloscardovia macacae]